MKLSDSFYERSRTAAIWLLRIESLILIGIVIYLLLATVFSTATWPSALIGEIIFASIGAIGLYFASTGFARRRSYGRAPAVLANLIAIGVSYYMISGGLFLVGIPLALLGAITLVSALFGYNGKE
ncbi:MAG: hypothetical protein F2672_03005 [Actinobacteria bacterium]|uniref:Unannotated protein n=1 Tax=freshwater metagenome TaxID=449393 RepID=A0A6J6PYE7_9ZZZZ|nr:hypothetical protein [Actinomycetota bacterium]